MLETFRRTCLRRPGWQRQTGAQGQYEGDNCRFNALKRQLTFKETAKHPFSVSASLLHRRDLTCPTRGTFRLSCVSAFGASMRPDRFAALSTPVAPRSERRDPLRRYPAAWKAAFPVSASRGALTGRTGVSPVPWTVHVRPMQRTRRPFSQLARRPRFRRNVNAGK